MYIPARTYNIYALDLYTDYIYTFTSGGVLYASLSAYTIQTHLIIITSLMYKQTDADIRYIAIVRLHGIISKPRPFYHYNDIIQILCFNVLHFNIII